jgi:DNA invertase Pin-like site-specific DNA recombinase
MKGSTKSPETIARMKATRAKMWEDPEYAARMRAQLIQGHKAPHTKGWTKPTIRGENHPRSKLTNAQTAEIRAQYAAGGTSLNRLATAYGVSQKTISNIIHDKIRHAIT